MYIYIYYANVIMQKNLNKMSNWVTLTHMRVGAVNVTWSSCMWTPPEVLHMSFKKQAIVHYQKTD